MSGPWEQYAKEAQEGPWTAYAAKAELPVDPTGSFVQNAAAGAGKALVDLGRGAKQLLDIPAVWLENKLEGPSVTGLVTGKDKPTSLLGRAGSALGMPTAKESAAKTQEEVNESKLIDAPLMKTAGGVTGNIAGNVATSLLIPGGGTYGGAAAAGATMGVLQPTAGGESRLLNTAVGGAAGVAGKAVGNKIAGAFANKQASSEAAAATRESQNVVRDSALAAGREAGYVVPPRMVQKQGALGGIVEGFGGKTKTEQLASNKNQVVTNDLARKALGIEEDAPITVDVLKGIRAKAGEAYEALRGAGTITADKQFSSDLAKITQKYQGASKDFPELAKNEVGDIVASINKPSFSSDAAIDAISILRDKAAAAYAKGDKSIGSAYKATSQAMEDAIERNLIENGSAEAVKAFQAARRLIAKTYSVENALSTTGDVSAAKIAAQLGKGKPLEGELKTIGRFAGAFPKATQTSAKVEPHSVLDLATMGGLGAAGAGPAAMIPLARPAARSVVLSDTYQKLMASPEYGTSALLRGAAKGSKVLPRLLPGSASVGAFREVE